MRKRGFFLIILLLSICLLSTACKKDIETGGAIVDENLDEVQDQKELDLEPVEGGQVIIPLTNLTTLDPLKSENNSYFHFSKLIFDSLFEFGDDLYPRPRLVYSYELLSDGKTINLKLRDDVKWHDGNRLTTEDVAFTIETIKQGKSQGIYASLIESSLNPLGKVNFKRVIKCKIIDEQNMEIVFDKVYSNKLEVLTFPIIQKATYNDKDYQAIGSGPYKLVDFESNKSITLESNKLYWDGPVYIDRVIGKIMANENMMLNAFEIGQVDFATTTEVDWRKYQENPNIRIVEYSSSDIELLGFNQKSKVLGGDKATAIRKAIAYSINRGSILEKVYSNNGMQIDIAIHPSSYLLAEDAYVYGHNLEKAKDILSKTGLKPEDLNLSIRLNTKNEHRNKTVNILIEDLAKIGINLTIEEDPKKAYDIILIGWSTSVVTDLSPILHSGMIKGGTNLINYRDKHMDKLLNKSLYSETKDDKLAIYDEIQSKISEELPYITLFFRNKGVLSHSRIKGPLKPTFFDYYRGLDKCFIPLRLQ